MTVLFRSNIKSYGTFRLDMDKRLDLIAPGAAGFMQDGSVRGVCVLPCSFSADVGPGHVVVQRQWRREGNYAPEPLAEVSA